MMGRVVVLAVAAVVALVMGDGWWLAVPAVAILGHGLAGLATDRDVEDEQQAETVRIVVAGVATALAGIAALVLPSSAAEETLLALLTLVAAFALWRRRGDRRDDRRTQAAVEREAADVERSAATAEDPLAALWDREDPGSGARIGGGTG